MMLLNGESKLRELYLSTVIFEACDQGEVEKKRSKVLMGRELTVWSLYYSCHYWKLSILF